MTSVLQGKCKKRHGNLEALWRNCASSAVLVYVVLEEIAENFTHFAQKIAELMPKNMAKNSKDITQRMQLIF